MTRLGALRRDQVSGLQYRLLPSEAGPQARLLLLHGVGSNERSLLGLASTIDPQVDVLLLQGPRSLGPDRFGWFGVRFGSDGPAIEADEAEASRRQLLAFVDALAAEQGGRRLPTVIAGFSQGGIMSASVGLSAPQAVAGFAVLSGRILPELEPHVASRDALSGVRAFIAHGRQDGKLPPSWADQADDWLTRLGVPHRTRFYPIGHELDAVEVSDFNDWLAETLGL